MDFLFKLLMPFWQPIAAAVGGLLMVAGVYFAGRKAQADKGKMVAQKETINAHKDRDEIDAAVAGTTPNERKRLRDKWNRDN